MCFSTVRSGDVAYLRLDPFWERGVLAAFSTRAGGFSAPPYGGLNMGYTAGDDPEAVLGNRLRFLDAVGVGEEETTVAAQVHGVDVLLVGSGERGRGIRRGTSAGQADGMVTALPRTFLMQTYADCVPLVAMDTRRPAVAIGHAGWRGTAAGMGEALVDRLAARGSLPEDLLVGIGPAIGGECYPVGEEVLSAVLARYPWAHAHIQGDLLDLKAVNREALCRRGVPESRVFVSQACTSCDGDRFFSYRREGRVSGRLAGIVGMIQEE